MAGIDRRIELEPAFRDAARRFGTPLYITDVAALEEAARELEAAFPDPWLRSYSLKANDLPAIMARLADLGLGANVVSRGEWALARRAGIPADRTTFEGIGKTDRDLADIVRTTAAGAPLRWVAVESDDELRQLGRLAARAGLGGDGVPSVEILLRLNPAVQPETHGGLAVGAGGSKFGMEAAELTAAAERASGLPGIDVRGIHLHVGSQLGAIDSWRDAVRRALATLALVRGASPHFDTLDVGGGFPVGPAGADGEPSPMPPVGAFGAVVPELLSAIPDARRPLRLAVEPGRFLVARAGWLLARVLHARDRGGPMVVLDAGMTELIRPALYGARHAVVAVGPRRRSSGTRPTQVEGPICESTDHLGLHELPPLRRGDLVAIRDAGAYGGVLASAYNGRPRPPQVLIEPDGRLVLARRRGTLAGLA